MAARGFAAFTRFQQLLNVRECRQSLHCISLAKSYCSAANIYNNEDPAPYFFDENVQRFLKRLNEENFTKVYRTRYYEKRLKVPKYEFLTEEALQEAMENAREKAGQLLQMPPVLKVHRPMEDVLSRDPGLTGHDTTTHIFSDITFGVSDTKRVIVVRDADGTLRQASWDERARMNQIYNPRPGRKLLKPKMFLEENLKDVIAREKYEFVLDRACAQFEPDDPEYQKVCSVTYEALEEKRQYQMLHSTRHYGPMCFYLAWHRRIDNLLIDFIQKEKLSSSVVLVQLYHYIHKASQFAQSNIEPSEHVTFVKAYIEEDSLRRPQLQLAVQHYEDLLLQREQYEKSVQASHGL